METLKHIGQLVLMALIAVVFVALVVYAEIPLIGSKLTVGVGYTYEHWLEEFRLRAACGIGVAWLSAWTWYLYSQLSSWNDWERARQRRVVWFVLLLLPLVAFIVAWLTMPAAQEGGLLALAFILFNNVFVYYLATACFSPWAVKYTPPGAVWIRHW